LGVSRTADGGLDPRLASGSAARGYSNYDFATAADTSSNGNPFFDEVGFTGAFGNVNWASGWSALADYGFLGDQAPSDFGRVTVSGQITEDVTWTEDNEYILDGIVFVTGGATLTIEPGTTVRGKAGQNLDAAALVVTRTGMINAEGTPTKPIIFTAEFDEGLTKDDVGLWGGVILLGEASTNNSSEKLIEGVSEITSDPALAGYGGTNDADNSGVMRYVSIRHSGINIGSSSGNEIQGLTVGGVGSGTTLEYIESFASGDDGFEFFGGTVNTKYLISAFNNDDAFDWDQGFRGKGQFWFAILDTDTRGRAAEMDGAGGDETGTPYANPRISNVTYIGSGSGASASGDTGELLMFRDNTAGLYTNSIFMGDMGYSVDVEDVANNTVDSRARLEADELNITYSHFFDFGNGEEYLMFAEQLYAGDEFALTVNNNTANVNPQLTSISRTNDGNLNPTLAEGSAALTYANFEALDDFYTEVAYTGAFGSTNWLAGWSALADYGFTSDEVGTSIDEDWGTSVPSAYTLEQNYPNPFNPTTNIKFALPNAADVKLEVFNILGQRVGTLVNGQMNAGYHTVTFDATNLSSGVYIYRISAGQYSQVKRMMLIK